MTARSLPAAVPLARTLRRPVVVDEVTAVASAGEDMALLDLRPEIRFEVAVTALGTTSGAATAFGDAMEAALREPAGPATRLRSPA